ncbi:MAG: oxidoreductase [Pseudomonas sp.]|jgi:predicted DsbA family dithiol-disulfide isomerase|nr:oxidoreductase [Pseudomonas sp.]
MTTDGPFKIDVWSDYVCPFCYLQLPVFDQIQQTYGQRAEITWHAFELRPEPIAALDPNADFLRATWSRSVLPLADKRNVVMKMPTVQPRSRKALEAAAFAHSVGLFEVFHRQTFKAFFEHGRDIGHTPTLIELGGAAGLDVQALQQALDANAYTDKVTADQELAERLGLRAVPVLLLRQGDQPLEQAKIFNGTLPFERFRQEIERLAW